MRIKKRRILCGILILVAVIVLAACGAKQSEKAESESITEKNLSTVCDVLKAGGLSNVDAFAQWVIAYSEGNMNSGDSSGFSDADCRMTVILLAGNSITYAGTEETYDGTYLMFDVEAIENQEAFSILKDKKNLFTTLFGEMPISANGFADSYADKLKKYGMVFEGEVFSVISILFKAYEEDKAFVGHTGILVDCRENEKVDANYMFVEKIAFGDPFTVTLVNDDSELIEVLSKRSDYSVEEGDPAPVVYKDGNLIGELKYATD